MALATTNLKVPNFILQTLFILSVLKRLISWVFGNLGLGALIDSDTEVPPLHDLIQLSESQLVPADVVRKTLPVVKFQDLVSHAHHGCRTDESCAVCLCEFKGEDEVRPLMGCRHMFHRCCLDGWIDHERRDCPLCRTPFIPIEMQSGLMKLIEL